MARDLAFRSATLVRGTLVAVISAKSLNLPHSEAQKFKATRLASNEAEEVAGTIPVFHDIWSGALELAISIFFLEQLIGDAAYVALLPGLGMFLKLLFVLKLYESNHSFKQLQRFRGITETTSLAPTLSEWKLPRVAGEGQLQ